MEQVRAGRSAIGNDTQRVLRRAPMRRDRHVDDCSADSRQRAELPRCWMRDLPDRAGDLGSQHELNQRERMRENFANQRVEARGIVRCSARRARREFEPTYGAHFRKPQRQLPNTVLEQELMNGAYHHTARVGA